MVLVMTDQTTRKT